MLFIAVWFMAICQNEFLEPTNKIFRFACIIFLF
ncbi:hypothetical protein CoNPh26_CDS0098 [Staphylococcus phage S-CoN_Ph26]|nr:hypothetical protein CoNPh26_CDS0098 [Staphylococcus phage S-CoN_Ph26]